MSIPDGTARYNTQKPVLGMSIPDKYRNRSYVNDVRLIEDHPPPANDVEYKYPKKSQYSIHQPRVKDTSLASSTLATSASLEDKVYQAKSLRNDV